MAAGTWTWTDAGVGLVLDGTLRTGDSYTMILVDSTSNIGAASTTLAGVTGQLATANGYTSGGAAISLTKSGTRNVKVDVVTDPVWNATGAGLTAKWAVIAEISGSVLCYCLLDSGGANVTVAAGNPLTVAAHATDGIFRAVVSP